jgi:hypothetical protein
MTQRQRLLLLIVALVVIVPGLARAEIILPPGFTMQVYVTGDGFDSSERAARGLPSVSTLAVDEAGVLYLARTGRRYSSGEVDDLWPVYRIPPGGAQVTKANERRFLYGPPLPSAQVAGLRGGRDLLVTTFDRDRKVGVLYVMDDGRPELFAGGTPPRGASALLVQPEAAVADAAGNVYVADRAQDRVVKLGPRGAILDQNYMRVKRPRLLLVGTDGALWVAGDGTAEAPWSRGPGEIWRVASEAAPALVLRGPVAASMSFSPTGHLFVADRQAPEIFATDVEGRRLPFARFTDGDAPRALVFAPRTPQTERAGIAGSLFLVAISRGAWPVNEIIKITGPFERYLREQSAPAR